MVDFSQVIEDDDSERQQPELSGLHEKVAGDQFVDELQRIALQQHEKEHETKGISSKPQIALVQNSFNVSTKKEEGLAALLDDDNVVRKVDAVSGEYKRISEQLGGGNYGIGGGEYGSSKDHAHGPSATFATCCGGEIKVQSTPNGRLKIDTNIFEKVKNQVDPYHQGQGGYGSDKGDAGGGGYDHDDGGFGGYG